MPTHGRHLLHDLARLPWWMSVLLVVIAFAALRWVAPALTASSRQPLAQLGQAAADYAWISFVLLLSVPLAIASAAKRRRLIGRQSTIDSLRSMPWQDFEQLVGQAYRRKGYRVVDRGGSLADGGVDLELRSKDKKIVVQCKRWKTRSVGVPLVRELYGAMAGEEAHGGIFVTSGRYTPDAIDFARDKPIELVDGAGLIKLLNSVQAAARPFPAHTSVVVTFEGPITCPRCGAAMVRRVAKQGATAGSAFWGCSQFPLCRGTKAVAVLT